MDEEEDEVSTPPTTHRRRATRAATDLSQTNWRETACERTIRRNCECESWKKSALVPYYRFMQASIHPNANHPVFNSRVSTKTSPLPRTQRCTIRKGGRETTL
ncbi:hypothetical protein AB1N83_001050 [Pleurotus pulmonarius]